MRSGHWFAGSVGAACLVGTILVATNEPPVIAQNSGVMQLNCGDRPCDVVAHGRQAFNDRKLKDLGGNGRACADCHMPSEAFQLSPAAARARFEALLAKRATDPSADDPLFRPIDADDFRENGEQASDFSNLVENGLVRVTMPLPANVVLIDPSTGQPTSETSVDVWRAVIPVFNVAITGPDGQLPVWPAGAPRIPIMGQDPNGPNRQGGYQHDARFGTLQEQARAALIDHAEVTVEPPADMLDALAASSRRCFVEQESSAGGGDPSGADIRRSGSGAGRARATGEGRVQPCLCHVPRRHVASRRFDAGEEHRAPDRHPVSQHPDRVSAAGDRRIPAVSAATRAQRADIPDHAGGRHVPDSHDVGSRTAAPHWPAGGPWRDGLHAAPRHRPDRTVLPQQLRRDARGSARPVRCVLQEIGEVVSATHSAPDHFVGRVRSSIVGSSRRPSGPRCWRTFESCRRATQPRRAAKRRWRSAKR